MKHFLHTLTIWLVVAVRHWLRVGVVAFFVLGWIALMHGDTGDWYDVARGAVIGLFFSVVFVFDGELADELEK
jgi:hypothetical protein